MSRELVLCILIAAYDKIQTTQFNDVAQFGNTRILSRKPLWWKRKIIAGKVTCLWSLPRCARHIVEETVSPGSNHGLQSLARLVAACGARAACGGFGFAPNTFTTLDVFSWLQVTNFDVSLLHSAPNGPDHIDIRIFVLCLHDQLFRSSVRFRMTN